MTKKQQKQVDKIIKVLEGQRFYDFYVTQTGDNCLFDEYMSNRREKPKLKKEVEEKIKELFDVE